MTPHYVRLQDGLTIYCAEYLCTGKSLACPPILCLAGMTRNSRDFESLAPWLASEFRVFAADLRGRGYSDRDPEWQRYRLEVYLDDIRALLNELAIPEVIVIGTSLGGLIGLCLGRSDTPRIAGLVLNDIGPELDPTGLERIARTVGTAPTAQSWPQAARQLAAGHAAAMPDYEDDDWLRFARRLCREQSPGVIERDMDPLIGRAMRESGGEIPDFWETYLAQGDKPMLALRGELSDLLSLQTLQRMQSLRPKLETATIARRGHTPTLDEPDSRRALAQFFDRYFGSQLLGRL
jgi:pimeloyl-ACP methyl ester carboxylesterase